MNKKQIKEILAIVRPAIIAIYGRQRIILTAYNKMSDNCLWVEIEGWVADDPILYKARIEYDEITYLNEGKLR